MAVGFKIADGYVEVHAEVDEDHVRRAARRTANTFGDEVDRTSGDRADRTGRTWGSRLLGGFLSIFKTNKTLSRILPGWFEAFANPIGALGLAAGVAAAAQFVAGFLSVGLTVGIGGAFIGLAALILKNNKEIKKSWADMTKAVTDAMKRAAQPMVAPFVAAIGQIKGSMKTIEPIMKNIFAGLAPSVGPLTTGLIAFATNFLSGIEKAVPGINEIMQAFAKELPDFGTALGDFFVYLADHKEEIIGAMKVVFTILQVSLGVLAWMLVELSRELVVTAVVWNTLTGAIGDAAKWLGEKVPAAFGAIKDFFVNTWNSISDFFKDTWNSITGFFTSSGDSISTGWSDLWGGIKDFFSMIWDGILAYLGSVWDFLMGIVNQGLANFHAIWDPFWNTFGELFKATWDLINAVVGLGIAAVIFGITWGLEIVKAMWNAAWIVISDFFKVIWNGISDFFGMIWDKITGYYEGRWTAMLDYWKWLWNGISGFFVDIWNSIYGRLSQKLSEIWDFWVWIWNKVSGFISYVWHAIVDEISSNLNNAWAIITGIGGKIAGFFSGLYNDLKNAARHLMQGLIDGITEKIRDVVDQINKLTQIIRDHFPGSPIKMGPLSGDHGPVQSGRKIAEMVASGLAAGVPSVKAALEALVVMPTTEGGTALPPGYGNGGGGGGDTIINLKGVWDFTDPAAAQKIVAALYDAIEQYKKGYAR